MGKIRFNNLQISIQAMKKYINQLLLKSVTKTGLPIEEKNAKNTEPEELPQSQGVPQREKKDSAEELSAALAFR